MSPADYNKFIAPRNNGDNTFLKPYYWTWNFGDGVYIYTPPSLRDNVNLDNGAGGGNSGAGGIHMGHLLHHYAHNGLQQGH